MNDGNTPNPTLMRDMRVPAVNRVEYSSDKPNAADIIVIPKSTIIEIKKESLKLIIEKASTQIKDIFRVRLDGLNIKNNTPRYISYFVTAANVCYFFSKDIIEMFIKEDFESWTLKKYDIFSFTIAILVFSVICIILWLLYKNHKASKNHKENNTEDFSLSNMMLPEIEKNALKILDEAEKKLNKTKNV